jgi:hypothetical protein
MWRSLPLLTAYALIVAIMILGCSSPPDNPPASISPASVPADGTSADGTSADGTSADGTSADGTSADGTSPDDSLDDSADLSGTIACGKAARALNDGTLMHPGVITDITRASGTADAPVADAANHLSEAYTEAVGAHGTDAEPDAVAAVSRAAAELIKICRDSGLETVG